MEFSDATQKATQILNEERTRPTARYVATPGSDLVASISKERAKGSSCKDTTSDYYRLDVRWLQRKGLLWPGGYSPFGVVSEWRTMRQGQFAEWRWWYDRTAG
jgi:hypothetical protein